MIGSKDKITDLQDGSYGRTKMQKEIVLQKLKEKGCRITRQRRILLDIILESDCSCCKEIYYQAAARDPKIGAATVYRMVNTLEEIGAISRKNMYKVSCGDICPPGNEFIVEFADGSSCRLTSQKWKKVLKAGLETCGYTNIQDILTVSIKQ